jgi:hypothetical protein
MEALRRELNQQNKVARLSSAVEDVDKIIELLQAARDQVAGGMCDMISAGSAF